MSDHSGDALSGDGGAFNDATAPDIATDNRDREPDIATKMEKEELERQLEMRPPAPELTPSNLPPPPLDRDSIVERFNDVKNRLENAQREFRESYEMSKGEPEL